MATLVNDLVSIIATYTTTSVTFDLCLLTPDLAARMYQRALWYHKMLYESSGMIPDGTEKWSARETYVYYLSRNRTIYGDLLTTSESSVPRDYGLCTCADITTSRTPPQPDYIISQLVNGNIVIIEDGNRRIVPFGTKVRKIISGTVFSYLLTERGQLYVISTLLAPRLVDTGSELITDIYYDGNVGWLYRTGQLNRKTNVDAPIIELDVMQKLMTTTTRIPYLIIGARMKKIHIGFDPLIVWIYGGCDYVDSTRTTYHDCEPIIRTRNRTQLVKYIGERGIDLMVIVDA